MPEVLVGLVGGGVNEMSEAFSCICKNGKKYRVINMETEPEAAEKVDLLLAAEASPLLAELIPRIPDGGYLVVNADEPRIFPYLAQCSAKCITYGFNPRSCITVSSIGEENLQICLQRFFVSMDGSTCEPSEYPSPINDGSDPAVALGAAAACAAHGLGIQSSMSTKTAGPRIV